VLGLCADVRENGFVRVTILDAANRKLAESERIVKTVTDGAVQWQGGFSLEDFTGRGVRLQFELRKAKLYSFGFDLKSRAEQERELSEAVADGKADIERAVGRLIAAEMRARKDHAKAQEARFRALLPNLRDGNPRVRERAADTLGAAALSITDVTVLESAVAPLIAAIRDDDMEVRDESTEALGNIAARIEDAALLKAAIAALVGALSDEDAEVREEAAESLGKVASGSKEPALLEPAVKPLRKALQDPAEEVRSYAAKALRAIEGT
jgi:hypothetical protein